jgi:hypothetical protein
MTIELPPYPKGAGPAIGYRLRERRQQAASAREELAHELSRLETQAAITFEELDARDATRQRLAALARDQREQNRRSRS